MRRVWSSSVSRFSRVHRRRDSSTHAPVILCSLAAKPAEQSRFATCCWREISTCISAGTGLAPFLSLIKDPTSCGRFEKVVLVYGVSMTSDLADATIIEEELPSNDIPGADVRAKPVYYSTATREPYQKPKAIHGNRAAAAHPTLDRMMLCGSPGMLKTMRTLLDTDELSVSPRIGESNERNPKCLSQSKSQRDSLAVLAQ